MGLTNTRNLQKIMGILKQDHKLKQTSIYTLANGAVKRDKVKGSVYGTKMVKFMKVIGKMVRLMAKEG